MTAPPLRLIITGSQNFPSESFVWGKLTPVLLRIDRPLIIVHGGCRRGADRFADNWVSRKILEGEPVSREVWEADWSNGLSGGFRRSERMVRAGGWGIYGFVADCIKPDCKRPRPHGSHGTMHCLKVAKNYKIPIKAWKTKGWKK